MSTYGVPVDAGSDAVPHVTANDRFKRSFRTWFWGSMVVATVAHFSLFAFWPEMTAADVSHEVDQLEVIDFPPEVVIPPEPARINKPARPIITSADISEDITIPVTTFEEYPVESLPPPPEKVTTTDPSEMPTFTPFTVKPDIKNRDELQRALEREYPPLLRDAGIGGTANVWFFIDEDGNVVRTLIQESSGHKALDDAAIAVANIIEFTPALNRDKRVAVWISLGIKFETR